MSKKKQKQEKVTIGLYPDVLQRIDEETDKQNRSRSNMIDVIVRKYFKLEVEEETKSSEATGSIIAWTRARDLPQLKPLS